MMNKMMETMMAQMMEQMMPKMMEAMMTSMMNAMVGTTPEVATAKVEAPKNNAMSVDDFLALAEEEDDAPVIEDNGSVEFVVVDFKPRNGRKYRKGLKYNKFLGKAVWTYNHISIKKKYPAIKYSEGCYYSDDMVQFKAFASQYPIVERLNDEQMAEVRAYWDSKKNK